MADTQFKVGSTVRMTNPSTKEDAPCGTVGVIRRHDSGTFPWIVDWQNSADKDWYTCVSEEEIELVSEAASPTKRLPPKFILQYELDADPFEFFATEKEARKRIAELAERTDLKRDSIRLI